MHTILALALLAVIAAPTPVCRVGIWTGSPAELAAIEAQYQLDQAREAGTAHPGGAPNSSPWTGLVRCSLGS